MRVLPLVVWLVAATVCCWRAEAAIDTAKIEEQRKDALRAATPDEIRAIRQMLEEKAKMRADERDTTRDGQVIKWRPMSDVRRLQSEGKKLVIARIEPIDTRGLERRLEVVAAELRARGAEEAVWIRRTPPGDEDSAWLRWEGVHVSTEIILITGNQEDKAQVYTGSDTFTDLLTWLLAYLPPPRPKMIRGEAEMDKFMLAAPVSLIAYVPAELGEDGSFQEFVRKIAQRHPYLPVGLVYPAEELPYTKHALSPISIYYRDEDHVFPLDEDRLREMDDFTRDNALKKASHQFISRFPDDAAHIFSQGIDKIVFVFEAVREGRGQTPSFLRELALEMRQRVVIAYVDYTDKRMVGVKEFFGVELPGTIRGFDARTERQYWPEREHGLAFPHEVAAFVRELAANKLTPHRKNEPLDPEGFNKDGATRQLNADTFQETALSPSLDTVVVFFATWCPHSKRFIERYLRAAEESVGVREVVFAVLDTEKNDVETKTKIRLFPTIILFRKGTNEEVVYTGRRNVPEFLRWLDEEVARAEEEGEEPVREDESVKGYESPLKKAIKLDYEQGYTLEELDEEIERGGSKGGKESSTAQLGVQDLMNEKVLERIGIGRPTIADVLEKEMQIKETMERVREEEEEAEKESTVAKMEDTVEEKKDTVVEPPKEHTVVQEKEEKASESEAEKITVVETPEKEQEDTVDPKVVPTTDSEDPPKHLKPVEKQPATKSEL